MAETLHRLRVETFAHTMRAMKTALVLIIGLAACSSSGIGSSTSAQSLPTMCEPSKAAGTYLLHWDTLSGNCGDVSDSIVVLNGMTTSASGCTFTTKTLSDGDCRADEAFSCFTGGVRVDYSGYLVVQDPNDGAIKGKISVSIPGQCMGLYGVTYTRQ